MHPGWYCFMCALGAGFFIGIGLCAAILAFARNTTFWPAFMETAAGFLLFWVGGNQAEKLYERD